MSTPTHPVGGCEKFVPVVGKGSELVCFGCGGRAPVFAEKENESATKSDILPPSERDRMVRRAKRKLLQGRAMIDEALRELEGLEAAGA